MKHELKAKRIRISNQTVGRKVLVKFTDIGKIEGIAVELRTSGYTTPEGKSITYKLLRVFSPANNIIYDVVEESQIIKVGDIVEIGNV